MKILLNFLFVVFAEVESVNIFGYFPSRSISNHMVFRPIIKELSRRGHNLTIVTPFPINEPDLVNVTEIDLGECKETFVLISGLSTNFSIVKKARSFYSLCGERIKDQLENKLFQEVMNSNREFDLVLVQSLCPIGFVAPAKFKAPVVAISSMGVLLQTHDSIGNPTHPLLYKDIFFNYQGQPTLFDKVNSILYNIWYRALYYWYFLPQADKLARQYFGDDIPYLGDVEKNVSLVLVNENCLMNTVRPNMPNIIEIGQVHIREKRPLPKDLQEYLDKSTKGVIYLSLGSNVKSANLSESVRNTIIEALSELPYNVLWKWETDSLPGQPKNVLTRKWLPQQDVLGHKNVKAFITQGGYQSIEEAIHNEIPMIGMPFMSDQPENVRRLVELGMARMVDYRTMTKDELKNSILDVAQNKKYKQNVQKSKAILEDQPIKGLDKAIWWIEYVIRHKGAPHLRSPAADMPFYEYFMLDAIAIILIALLTVIFVLYYILRTIAAILGLRRNAKKIKTN